MTTQPPPADFDATARRAWRVALAELQTVGSWTPATGELLAAYCRALMAARLARERIARRAAEHGDDEAYTTHGSQGQKVQAPDLKTMRDAERDAVGYAAALMLTPAARKRLGIEAQRDGDAELDGDLGAALRVLDGGRR